jgi:hypothetical protein
MQAAPPAAPSILDLAPQFVIPPEAIAAATPEPTPVDVHIKPTFVIPPMAAQQSTANVVYGEPNIMVPDQAAAAAAPQVAPEAAQAPVEAASVAEAAPVAEAPAQKVGLGDRLFNRLRGNASGGIAQAIQGLSEARTAPVATEATEGIADAAKGALSVKPEVVSAAKSQLGALAAALHR